MSTGVVGYVRHLGHLWTDMTKGQGDLVGGILAVCQGLPPAPT